MSDISKVVYGNEVLIDLTQDTVNANNMLLGTTAHGANGEPIVGSLITHDVIDNLTSTSTEDALSANQGRVLKEMIDSIDGGNGGSVIRVTFEEECAGDTVTFAMSGMTTITKTVPSESPYMIEVTTTELGILTVTDVTQSIIKTININTYSLYTLYIALAGFEQWLEAGGITTQYASLAEVLADEKTVRTLFTKFASVDYLVSWAQVDNASATTILNDNYCAKWINLRDYALDTLYADTTCSALMDTADKYFYGEWVERDGVWQAKGNVPIMTSDSAPYGVASANQTITGYEAFKAFDGNDTTSWFTQTFNVGIIQYKSVNPICVKSVRLKLASISSATVQIKGSNDGVNFENIGELQNLNPNEDKTINVNSDKYYLYHSATITRSTQENVGVYSLQFYGRELKVSVPTMTSNTEPWGECSASSYISRYEPYKGFDGLTTTQWNSTGEVGTAWLCYDFKQPTVVKSFALYPYNSSKISFAKIQGSNNGTTWYDVGEITNTSSNTLVLFDIDNDVAYNMWRVKDNGNSNDFWFYYCNFYGVDYSEHTERHYIYDRGVELETITSGKATIDTTDYNLLRAEDTYSATQSDRLACGSANALVNGLPNNNYLDISSVNGSNATGWTTVGNIADTSFWVE